MELKDIKEFHKYFFNKKKLKIFPDHFWHVLIDNYVIMRQLRSNFRFENGLFTATTNFTVSLKIDKNHLEY